MVNRSRVIVLVLLVLVVVIAAWSRLRHVKDSDFEPQRIRLDEHPAFQTSKPVNREELAKPESS
jgi:hypothetical protein